MVAIYTVGHSNRTLEEFMGLLEEQHIEQVVDVRKLPGSTKYPQFNDDALGVSLTERGIAFQRMEALTGRRPVSKTVPFEVNAWWQVRSFHNYADHALAEEFAHGLLALSELGVQGPTAIMCAEAVWWRCHRRIISDHLLAHHHQVQHIMGPGKVVAAELSAGAVLGPNTRVSYPVQDA